MLKTYVLNEFIKTPWAILPEKLALIEEIVERHVNGEKLSEEEIQTRVNGSARPSDIQSVQNERKVVVLRVFGTIIPRADMFSEMSGATSARVLQRKIEDAVNDPSVSAIVLDVDSPGGQVGGVPELADKIYQSRGKKPIVTVASNLMASAAYWIGTASDEVVVSPSSDVGSIGVFMMHQDVSAYLAKEGVRITFISAGKYKVDGNPYEPLSESARSNFQESVNEIYEKFTGDIALHRGVDKSVVVEKFGEGRVVSAEKAVSLGMADRLGTLDDVIKSLLDGSYKPVSKSTKNVETQPEPEPSETAPEPVVDPRKVERLRNYLSVYGTKSK